MKHEQMAAIASPQLARSGMTRDEIVACVERRQELYDNFDARALAADYPRAPHRRLHRLAHPDRHAEGETRIDER